MSVEYRQESDEALLVFVADGDEVALEVLYDRHGRITYNVVYRIVRDRAVAEGILQDTFVQVWQKASDFANKGFAAAWIYRIARNKALDQLRRDHARPQAAEKPIEEHYTLQTDSKSPGLTEVEADVEIGQRLVQVRQALKQIPHDQRVVLELAYFEGMSQSQIADHTQTPLGTVKTRVRMGLQKLEHILRSHGYRGAQDVE